MFVSSRYSLSLAILLSFGHSGFASECNPDLFSENGLYYSESGNMEDAGGRLVLTPILDSNNRTIDTVTLQTSLELKYSPSGKLFIVSGKNGSWLNLGTPSGSDEAILVRNLTWSDHPETAKFISLFREDLGHGACYKYTSQPGLPTSGHFVREGNFTSYHSTPSERRNNSVLGNLFHFRYDDENGSSCMSTEVVRDQLGRDVTAFAYNGRENAISPTQAQALIERGIEGLALLVLPSPAYARRYEGLEETAPDSSLTVGGVQASLFHLDESQAEHCIELRSPIPTAAAGNKLLAALFSDSIHMRASEKLALSGNWRPIVSDIHIQRLRVGRTAGFLRINWR